MLTYLNKLAELNFSVDQILQATPEDTFLLEQINSTYTLSFKLHRASLTNFTPSFIEILENYKFQHR